MLPPVATPSLRPLRAAQAVYRYIYNIYQGRRTSGLTSGGTTRLQGECERVRV